MATEASMATGTCIAFSATAPTTYDAEAVGGYPSLTWTAATELRVLGQLGGTRAITSNTNLCDAGVYKTAGAIDNGEQNLQLAFDIDNTGQVILTNGFKNNTKVQCRETLTSGDVFYYTAVVTSSYIETVDGDEVKWNGGLAIDGLIVEVAA